MGALRELFDSCSNDIWRPDAVAEFDRLALASPVIARYATAGALISVLQIVDRDAATDVLEEKDALLRVLLDDFQGGRFRRLVSNILILAFARRLAALADKYCRWDDDGEAISQLAGALLEAAASYPLARRPSKLSANLAWETEKRLAKRLERERRQLRVEEEAAAEAEHSFNDASLWDPTAGPELGLLLAAEDATAALSRFEQIGIIDAIESELIETTVLYGWKLKECVAAGLWDSSHLTYKAAFCRLSRALKRIRNCIEMAAVSSPAPATAKKAQKK
jgi:hypothetical protein